MIVRFPDTVRVFIIRLDLGWYMAVHHANGCNPQAQASVVNKQGHRKSWRRYLFALYFENKCMKYMPPPWAPYQASTFYHRSPSVILSFSLQFSFIPCIYIIYSFLYVYPPQHFHLWSSYFASYLCTPLCIFLSFPITFVFHLIVVVHVLLCHCECFASFFIVFYCACQS